MRKNWLVTTGGIMAAMGGIPVLVASSGASIPAWWAHCVFPLVLVGIVGLALTGWAAKGVDEHSTISQVQVATILKPEVDAKAEATAVTTAIAASLEKPEVKP